MTVVVLLHKEHFNSWLSTFCNSISIIIYCMHTTTSKYDITAYVNNSFTFLE